MNTCHIFCAAAFTGLLEPVNPGDLVIAADGGYEHLEKAGVKADLILGDFDSLGFVPAGAEVYPVEKDDTDAMLAVREGLQRGYTRFLLYGSLDGPRLDHTVANFQTLQFLADHGARGWLIGNRQLVTVIKESEISFPKEAKGDLSVFCMGEPTRGITLEGPKYELQKGTLTAGFPLGVSNSFVGKPVRISVEQGSLLILCDRQENMISE